MPKMCVRVAGIKLRTNAKNVKIFEQCWYKLLNFSAAKWKRNLNYENCAQEKFWWPIKKKTFIMYTYIVVKFLLSVL